VISPLAKASARTALILFVFALLGTALLAYTFDITRDTIQKSEEEARLVLVAQTLPRSLYDNNLLADSIELPPSDKLGTDDKSHVYRARLKGKITAVVMEATAPDGYGGKIKLLVGIRKDGEISGVRVVSHNETPGLGDYIDIAKSQWIKVFDHTSLAADRPQDWRVKKDGGKFDYMAGATITPRAVVKAVHKTLLYFGEHRNELLGEQPKSVEDTK
jgi:electron transport complex protein RnfG